MKRGTTTTLKVLGILLVIFLFCAFPLSPQPVQATNTVTATVTGLNTPMGVAITPDGAYAYVTNYYGTVSVISTATNTVTATVTGLSEPRRVAITPNGAYAYVSNTAGTTVSVISTATPAVSVSPSSWTMDMGQSVTFIATPGSGSGSYASYQWYVDGSTQVGQSASMFSYSPASFGSHSVTATVTDSLGATSAQSSAVTITVAASPTVSIAPVGSLTIDVGQVQAFTATAIGGTGTLSYQWYMDGSEVSGATSASYFYTAAGTSHSVTCKVTDSASVPVTSPASNAVSVMVNPPLPTFGNKAIGTSSDQNDANAQSISYFKCTTTGSITDIIVYINGASSGNAIAALYAVNGGSAGALLEQSKSVSIGTTFSWVDFQLPTPYTVTAGTTYGLAIMGNIPLNLMEVSGTGQRDHNAVSSYAKGFANPFGTIWGTDNKGAISIYATGTSSPTPTPSPTATPNPTPTPTNTPTPTPTGSGGITSFTFGNTNIGTYRDQNDANAKSASYFRSSATGTITEITAYIARATATGNCRAAIYSVNGGTASALIEQTNEVSIGTSFAWVTFSFASPIPVTAGTVYCLAICSNDALNVFGMIGSGERIHNGNTYSSGFSNPFGTVWGTDTNGAMSIYASGSTGTGNAASTYSSNESSLLPAISLAILVILVAVCITRLSFLILPSNKNKKTK